MELVKFVSMYTEMGCPEETLQEAVYRELSGFEKEGYSATSACGSRQMYEL